MLSVVVVAVIILTENAHAGYYYPRPNIAFELPKKIPNFQEGFGQKTNQDDAVQQMHETVVSYSVPLKNYYYLHQNKIDQQHRSNLATNGRTVHSGGVPSFNAPAVNSLPVSVPESTPIDYTHTGSLPIDKLAAVQTLKIGAPINYQSKLAVKSLQDISSSTLNKPIVNLSALINQQSNLPVQHVNNIPSVNIPNVDITAPINHQSNFAIDTLPHLNIQPQSIPVNLPIQLKQQGNSILNPVHHTNISPKNLASVHLPTAISTEQHIINHNENSDLNEPIVTQNVVTPKITKHIYFHVPPPEIEEPILHPVIPRKKIYKIIFIKVPSQETKNSAQLQQLANQFAPIEDKVIIYVLSKKPEPQQVFLPKQVPSEHEVLFVKYSGNELGSATTLAEDNLEQSDTELLPNPRLQREAINGKP